METALQQLSDKLERDIATARTIRNENVQDAQAYEKYNLMLKTLLDLQEYTQSLIPAEKELHEVKFEEGYKQACIDNLIEPDDEVLFEHIKDIRQTYQSK